MAFYSFGTGKLTVVPEIGTETTFGTLQDVAIDISYSKKELYGEHQFPVDIARTSGKVSIKAKFAHIDAKLFNDVFMHGNAITAGNITTVTVTNQLMGATPYFAVEFEVKRGAKTLKFQFPKCSCSKLALSFKNEDYSIPDVDIDAVADENGKVYTMISKE